MGTYELLKERIEGLEKIIDQLVELVELQRGNIKTITEELSKLIKKQNGK